MSEIQIEKPISNIADHSTSEHASIEPQLAFCPVCGEPLEEYYPEHLARQIPDFRSITHPRKCACVRAKEESENTIRKQREHRERVRRLSNICFAGDPMMKEMTFEASTSEDQAAVICRKYAESWESALNNNLGLLLWGDVGTGKSYMAACIANMVLEQESEVRMLNLSDVLNTSFESREEILKNVRRCSLLIIDDFGIERETAFGMEIVFQVIDARYRSGKPLIVTTNISLNTMQSPKDTNHKRIYDRILEMCIPVQFIGNSLRPAIRKKKMEQFKNLIREVSDLS